VTLLSGSAYAVPAVNDAAADLCDGAPGECESGGDCLRRVVGQGGYQCFMTRFENMSAYRCDEQ
jgi:hypothetical protein